MRVLISGQAALALSIDEPMQVRPLNGNPASFPSGSNPRRLFDGCSDVSEHFVESIDAIDALTEAAWERDRALRLFLLLIDPEESSDFLDEYSDCLEELFKSEQAFQFVQQRMFSFPLPITVNFDRIAEAVTRYKKVRSLVESVIKAQEVGLNISNSYDALSIELFDSPNAKQELFGRLVLEGAVSELAFAIQHKIDIGLIRLKLANKYLSDRKAIMQWTAMLQTGPKKPKLKLHAVVEDYDDDVLWADVKSEKIEYQNPDTYRQVRSQQIRIIEYLKNRDIDNARKFAALLIEEQRGVSSHEHIAKSLSLLAQEAKLHEVPELQLEWAEKATRENPADPKTFGHLSDALISLGRLTDAERALSSAEAVGGRMFAENGRARILRVMKQYPEARKVYLSIAEEFADAPGVDRSLIGAADVLRDMGRGEDAVAEFRSLTKRFPLSSSVWTGLAIALMDIGRLDDALVNFGRSNATRNNTNSKNGRANALRYAGNFREANSLYDDIIRDFPNNSVALCGRAEVLRAEGKHQAALQAYDLAIARLPYSHYPLNGKCAVLFDIESYQEALAIYSDTMKRFPYDEVAAVGSIRASIKLGECQIALAKADKTIVDFPFFVDAKVARAQALRSLGKYDASLIAYDTIIKDHPYNQPAIIGRSSLLIAMGKYEEAEKNLTVTAAKTSRDWTRFALRSIIVESRQGKAAAVNYLSRGLKLCPFFSQRRLIRSTIALIEISRNRIEDADKIVSVAPLETSNIIQFHVHAATRGVNALEFYSKIIDTSKDVDVIDLAHEIAKRFGLLPEPALRDKGWIERAERRMLLKEAA